MLSYFTSVKSRAYAILVSIFQLKTVWSVTFVFEVRYKRSPDSLCSSVIFTRMVSPFYYSAEAALAILRPL